MPTINYNAALPALGSLSGRSSIDINKWVSELKGNITQLIKSLFANNEQGFAYDPNDLSTLYQDAAGTTALTGAGQTLGLVLDKSKGLVLGNNLVVNGDFSNGLNSWSSTASNVTNGVLNIVSDRVAWRYAYQNVSVTVGKTYILTLNVAKSGTDSCYITYGPLSNESSLSSGIAISQNLIKRQFIFTATESTHRIRIQNGSSTIGFTVSADDISLRELSGNHAVQSTSSMRPLLQNTPRRIQYDGIDDKLTTTLPAQLTGCTVVRAVPNVGTQILANQTIPTPYNDNTDHCGLIVINRALTATETSQITKLFNKAAGV